MSATGPGLILPDWPAPPAVRAVSTERTGGVSEGPYASLNLGARTADDPARVRENRRRLTATAGCPSPGWLTQVHGCEIARPAAGDPGAAEADGAVTGASDVACVVLSADCLPVLLCDIDGIRVGAAHAGWRGLAGGVVEATVAAMEVDPAKLMAWLGPCIGPAAFEVGPEVRAAFVEGEQDAAGAFRPGRGDRSYADLRELARHRLVACGVASVTASAACTYSEPDRFFSHRRDGPCGRLATLVWLAG